DRRQPGWPARSRHRRARDAHRRPRSGSGDAGRRPAAPAARRMSRVSRSAAERSFDVVLFGATGFVGKLAAEYLAAHAPASVRIGLAGRSTQRLEQVRASLGNRAAKWPLVQADSADRGSLEALAASTRVVASTVGPYH